MLNKFYHIYIENQSLDFLLILIIGFVAYYIARFIVTSIVVRIFRKTATKIDDILNIKYEDMISNPSVVFDS